MLSSSQMCTDVRDLCKLGKQREARRLQHGSLGGSLSPAWMLNGSAAPSLLIALVGNLAAGLLDKETDSGPA